MNERKDLIADISWFARNRQTPEQLADFLLSRGWTKQGVRVEDVRVMLSNRTFEAKRTESNGAWRDELDPEYWTGYIKSCVHAEEALRALVSDKGGDADAGGPVNSSANTNVTKSEGVLYDSGLQSCNLAGCNGTCGICTPSPESEEGDWWCPQCQELLSGSRVTYQERCDTCGAAVEWQTVSEMNEITRLRAQIEEIREMVEMEGQEAARKYKTETDKMRRGAYSGIGFCTDRLLAAIDKITGRTNG